MKLGIFSLAAALLLALPAMAGTDPCAADPLDNDSDGVCNAIDNCRQIANPTQCDTDSDGYGQQCDGDFNQSNTVTGADYLIFGPAFAAGTVPPANAAADMNCSLTVNGADFLLFGPQFAAPGLPGPSCTHPKGTPCP